MDDLKLIKKYYGEDMMHLCRKLFPTILEETGKLFSILDNNFQRTKYLYRYIKDNNLELKFKDYIYCLLEDKKAYIDSKKNIYELMDLAGYNLYECNSESDIARFKKYYSMGEELCTFNDDRLETNYVYFAVKKNVDDIKRENFKKPKREDEYGTSVISIQFTKGSVQTLSIKNRYNHTVENPDATYSNNLENIIPGLTSAFVRDKGYNINQENRETIFKRVFKLALDQKYYFVLREINNICYGPDNIIIDNSKVVTKYLEKEKYLVMENYILDLVNKKVFLYDKYMYDDFTNHIKNIKKIEIKKFNNNKKVILTPMVGEDIIIELDGFNRIKGYINNNIEMIGNSCFRYCYNIKYIHLNKVKVIGDYFAPLVAFANDIKMPSLKKVGNYFLEIAAGPDILSLPSIIKIKDSFMKYSKARYAIFPSLESIGDNFMEYNNKIFELYIPKVKKIGNYFLFENEKLEKLNCYSLEIVGNDFLRLNDKLSYLYFPSLKHVYSSFMRHSRAKYAYFPSLESVGANFLCSSGDMIILSLPKLIKAEKNFLTFAEIKYLYTPLLNRTEEGALVRAKKLKYVDFSSLQYTEENFMKYCSNLKELSCPNLVSLGKNSLEQYKGKIFAPKLKYYDDKIKQKLR